ncbi:MAG: glycosyltransferase family 4 protein [Candidatus Gribaldobacteria bacterium]|nr:glycosyltransferase family 4 protein [Candidatus Gribaldobacteria bacterium]
MKILIATPLFPPEIGGPATYVFNLAQNLAKRGVEVLVISFGNSENLLWERNENSFEKIIVPLKMAKGLRHISFFRQILQNGKNFDLIYIHDLWSVGLPVRLANIFSRKPLIVRLGGDSLWEVAVERGLTKTILPDYYEQSKNDRENLVKALQNFVLRGCHKVIFSSIFLQDIFLRYRPITQEQAIVLENSQKIALAISAIEPLNNQPPVLLYAGRLTKCKNLETLLKVFSEVSKKNSQLIFKIAGNGPQMVSLLDLAVRYGLGARLKFIGVLSASELAKEITQAWLCVLPSLSEVSPNFALECLSLKKPLILTKYNGLAENIKNKLILMVWLKILKIS